MRNQALGRVAAALAAAMAIGALSSCGRALYADGEYQGSAAGLHAPVSVEVVVRRGKIAEVKVVSQGETEGVADLAMERIPAAIVKKQSVDVEVVAGASASSRAVMEAAGNALAKAKK